MSAEQSNVTAIFSAHATPAWPPRGGVLNLQSSADLRDQPDPEFLIDGVLPEDVIFQVYGPSGQYKSFLTLDMLLSIANGVPWLGHRVTRPGRCVYVVSEGGTDVGSRVRAWLAAHPGCTDEDLAWSVEEGLSLLDPETVTDVIDTLRGSGASVVVFDTQQDHMTGGDENSARDIGLLVESIKRIRRETGVIAGTVHHTGWDTSRERGSSAQRGKFDLVIPVNQGVVACKKSKYAAAFEPFRFDMVKSLTSVVPVARLAADATPQVDMAELYRQTVSDPETERRQRAYGLVLDKPDHYARTPLARKLGGHYATASETVRAMVEGPSPVLVEVEVRDTDKRGHAIRRKALRVHPDYDPQTPIEGAGS